jgi:hypothetical protein
MWVSRRGTAAHRMREQAGRQAGGQAGRCSCGLSVGPNGQSPTEGWGWSLPVVTHPRVLRLLHRDAHGEGQRGHGRALPLHLRRVLGCSGRGRKGQEGWEAREGGGRWGRLEKGGAKWRGGGAAGGCALCGEPRPSRRQLPASKRQPQPQPPASAPEAAQQAAPAAAPNTASTIWREHPQQQPPTTSTHQPP